MSNRKKEQENPQDRFFSLLKRYISIKTIQIVITMRSGEEIIISSNRDIINEELVITENSKAVRRIPLTEIRKADLYAA